MISFNYTEYSDVFSEEEAEHLSTHAQHDHAIEINKDEPSYEPLYNLFETELKVLQKYLNDVLIKG